MEIIITKNYKRILLDIKAEIRSSHIKAHLSVNKEMLILYQKIGSIILKNIQKLGWGSGVTKKLSEDLIKAFPNMKGFSLRNLEFMQQFASTYDVIVPKQLVSGNNIPSVFLIPWGHNIYIMQKRILLIIFRLIK